MYGDMKRSAAHTAKRTTKTHRTNIIRYDLIFVFYYGATQSGQETKDVYNRRCVILYAALQENTRQESANGQSYQQNLAKSSIFAHRGTEIVSPSRRPKKKVANCQVRSSTKYSVLYAHMRDSPTMDEWNWVRNDKCNGIMMD